jgi:hypothetical protein
MKTMSHLFLSFLVIFLTSSLLAQDKTQLAIDIADAREKSTEQLINYRWQRSTKVYLNEEEKNHTTVKVWFNDEGKMEGSIVDSESFPEEKTIGRESLEQTIGADLNRLYEQTFELVVNYVFLSKENWIELMDLATVTTTDNVVKIDASALLVQGDEIHILIDNNTKLFKSLKFSSSVGDSYTQGINEDHC